MHSPVFKKIRPYLEIALAAIVLVLIVLAIILVRQYDTLQQTVGSRPWTIARQRTADPANLQTWMTFDYIDHLFDLSPAYLQQNLSITDKRYPHITIEEYAEDAGLDKNAVLNQVESSIRTYLAPQQ